MIAVAGNKVRKQIKEHTAHSRKVGPGMRPCDKYILPEKRAGSE